MEEEPPIEIVDDPRPARRIWFAAGTVALVLLAVAGYAAGAAQRTSLDDRTERASSSADDRSTTTTTSTTTPEVSTTSITAATPDTTPTTNTNTSTTVAPGVPAPAPDPHSTGHVFPIQPASGASYASSHHDYPAADMFAPCGSDVVAPFAGTVQETTTTDTWVYKVNDPATRGGLSFSIVGDDGVRYYGSHLDQLDPAIVVGAQVSTGQRIGTVGDTGNAAGTGCHLHFGISTPCGPGDVLRRRGEFWPQPYLDAWRRSEPRSPADEVTTSPC